MNDGYNEFGMDERKFRQCNTRGCVKKKLKEVWASPEVNRS